MAAHQRLSFGLGLIIIINNVAESRSQCIARARPAFHSIIPLCDCTPVPLRSLRNLHKSELADITEHPPPACLPVNRGEFSGLSLDCIDSSLILTLAASSSNPCCVHYSPSRAAIKFTAFRRPSPATMNTNAFGIFAFSHFPIFTCVRFSYAKITLRSSQRTFSPALLCAECFGFWSSVNIPIRIGSDGIEMLSFILCKICIGKVDTQQAEQGGCSPFRMQAFHCVVWEYKFCPFSLNLLVFFFSVGDYCKSVGGQLALMVFRRATHKCKP